MQIEVAGMTKSTDDPELARAFLKFMISEPFQSAIPEDQLDVSGEAAGVRPAGILRRPRQAGEIAARPAGEVAENRRACVDEWLAAMSR